MTKSLLIVSTLALTFYSASRSAIAVEIDFFIGVDDYVEFYVDGELLGTYDDFPAGEVRLTKDLTPGWHDVRIVYKNRYGSNFLWFARKYPHDSDYQAMPVDEMRSLDAAGSYVQGLRGEYDGVNVNGQNVRFTVYGEGPVYHGYPDTYEGETGKLWAGEFDGWSKFTEVLTGQFFVGDTIEVEIDVKPGSDENPINLDSKGRIPVAILSSPEFAAVLIDENSVLFNGASVATRKNGKLMASMEDVNADGLPDLVCHFETHEVDAELSQFGVGFLSGAMYDGTPIEGFDIVTIVP